MKALGWLGAGLLLWPGSGWCQTVAQGVSASRGPEPLVAKTISFDFQRAELTPPRWGFEILDDGHGRYYEKASADASSDHWQNINVSASTMALLKAGSTRQGDRCETTVKNIAKTGKKTLSYWHGDTPWTCEFNYSDDDGVMKTANAFQAMAETIQIGERLVHDHRYDRLSLDADMQNLEDEVKAGRAIEVENIAPILQSLVSDEHVIDRAKRRAARLLEQPSDK